MKYRPIGLHPDEAFHLEHGALDINSQYLAIDRSCNSGWEHHPVSQSIPMAPLQRSESEVQLDEEVAMAEYRDYVMSQRIACAKKKKQQARGIPEVKKVPARYPEDSLQAFLPYVVPQVLMMQTAPVMMQTTPVFYYNIPLFPLEPFPKSYEEFDDYIAEEGIFELEL